MRHMPVHEHSPHDGGFRRGGGGLNKPLLPLSMSCILQTEDEQQGIIKEVFHMVSRRDDTVCNFVEGPTYVHVIHNVNIT